VSAVEIWYRYEDVAYAASADEFGESRGHGTIEIHLNEYRVNRRTPKGVFLDTGPLDGGWHSANAKQKFVLLTARKRFACPTKEEAQASFIARKRRQIKIYEARADRARQALFKMEITPKEPPCSTP
jgi:hypothetical protein